MERDLEPWWKKMLRTRSALPLLNQPSWGCSGSASTLSSISSYHMLLMTMSLIFTLHLVNPKAHRGAHKGVGRGGGVVWYRAMQLTGTMIMLPDASTAWSTIIRAVCGFGGMPQKAEPDIIQLELPQNVVTAYLHKCTQS
ncbi:MAG: hypothetical protein FRX49_05169 [Trebouxia sp. A1-2]|nr:MAG: hypothetical protein FRX49_05169 [Trebouxia sp. A1-2]